jgi:hypothetical protein
MVKGRDSKKESWTPEITALHAIMLQHVGELHTDKTTFSSFQQNGTAECIPNVTSLNLDRGGGPRLSWLRCFMIFLSTSTQIREWYIHLGYDRLLSHSSQISIH